MFIKEVDLFKSLGPDTLDAIARIRTTEVFAVGHTVFQPGDFAASLYIMVGGRIDITIKGQERYPLRVDSPGQVFGWSALVEPRRRRTTARCIQQSEAITIDGDRLMTVLKENPLEALKVMERVAGVIADRYIGKYVMHSE